MSARFRARHNWESLRIFAACAHHLSFTSAATELGLTQAAVSQRVKQLEDRLKVRLFTRTPRIGLTRAGAMLAPAITDAFAMIERALATACENRPLVVSTTLSMATLWLLPRLWQFRRRYPDALLSLDVTDDVRPLNDGRFDIAIRTSPAELARGESELLFPIRLTPMLAPRLLGTARQLTIEGLCRLALLRDTAWVPWFREAGMRKIPRLRHAGVAVNSQHLAAEAALAGEGVALLSPRFFAGHLASGRLIRPFRESVIEANYYVAWGSERGEEPAIRAIRRWLVSEAHAETDDA